MNPLQEDQPNQNTFNQAPAPQPLEQAPIQQPVMPPAPAPVPQPIPQAYAPAPVAQPSVPESGSAPLGAMLAIGLGAAAVIAQPIISGFATGKGSIWLLLIPLALGVAGVVLALLSLKKSALGGFLVLGIAISAIAAVTSFTTLTQSLIIQQRTATQVKELQESLKNTLNTNSSSNQSSESGSSSSDAYSDAMKSMEESRERINKQVEEARLRAESLSR